MLGLIIYIIAALCFIGAVVLLTFIPHKAARIVSLTMFCLLFIGGMTFLLFKASGQNDLGSVFEAMSGQTQTTGSIVSDGETQPEQTAGVSLGDAVTVATAPPEATPQTSQAQTPDAVAAAGVVGTWADPAGLGERIEIRPDGTCTIYFTGGNQESGTYTFDTENNFGMMLGDTFSLWYNPETDTIMWVEGTMVREGADAPNETDGILGMWYEQGYEDIYQLEFFDDGTMAFYEFGDPYNGTYTFDAATGYGEVILEGYTYDITYDAGNDILDFEGTYTRTPPDGSSGSDEDIVQIIVNDYFADIAAMEYDNAFTYLTGRAADEYYPEIFYGEDFDYADWGVMEYSVSGDTATVSVRHMVSKHFAGHDIPDYAVIHESLVRSQVCYIACQAHSRHYGEFLVSLQYSNFLVPFCARCLPSANLIPASRRCRPAHRWCVL